MPELARYSVGTIVGRAFRKAGVFAPDEQIPTVDYIEGLKIFGEMMDAWSLDRQTVYSVVPRTFKCKKGQTQYTYGPQGDWVAPRPTYIEAYAHVNMGDYSVMGKVLSYSMANWAYENHWDQQLGVGSSPQPVIWIQQGIPSNLVYIGDGWKEVTLFVKEPLSVSSFGEVDAQNEVIVDDVPKGDTEASNLNLNRALAVQVPPGYIATMVANLAVEIISFYPIDRGQLNSSLLVNRADDLYSSMRRSNRTLTRTADPRAPIPWRSHPVPPINGDGPVVDPLPKCKAMRWGGKVLRWNGRNMCWGQEIDAKGLTFDGSDCTFLEDGIGFK